MSIGAVRNPDSDAAIIGAARKLLDERGYAGFSLNEVARRAHASKPTLYRRWPNKAALIVDLYETERRERMALPTSDDFLADLRAIIGGLWQLWRDTPAGAALRGLIAEAQGDPSALNLLRNFATPDKANFARERIEKAIATRELPDDFDSDAALRLIMAFNWSQLILGRLNDETAIEPVLTLIFNNVYERRDR